MEWNSFLAKGQYVMQENFNKMFLIYLGPAIMDLKNNLTAYFYGFKFFFFMIHIIVAWPWIVEDFT